MFRILIVEDDPELLRDLKQSFDEEFPGSRVETAESIGEGMRLIKAAVDSGWDYHAAVLDFKLPQEKGLHDEVDESLCHEIRNTPQNTLVIHITSHVYDIQVLQHLRNFHQERGDPRAVVINKEEVSWLTQLLRKVRTYLYGNRIEAQMDKLFGRYINATSAGARSLARPGADDEGSITIELATLCREIVAHWDDLDEILQSRIQQTFDVETKSVPIRISLL